ncbi:Transporter, sodium/sulfate symporter family [hydrothermal vent metagenome]|uniref:Transporter, sodium/sulfate symporter family n=1 Tax=hydrothermal vent metagenome TaxID=652676 RepID=A0A3B1APS7_9ZZZZ
MKNIIAASIFLIIGFFLVDSVPNREIALVCSILILTIYLFIFEIVRVDVAAICIMVLLGLSGLFAPWFGLAAGLVPADHLFDGFSSNAVISIIAVMVIGNGLDKTGVMSKVAAKILKIGGRTERRIVPLISGAVGVISGFMQNVGAAALFLPVVSRISARTSLPLSRLLMPMGFTAILGGTMTMVGSSPLILLNDLIITSNRLLPTESQMDTFGLFDVTPIGVALVITGIIYFMVAGPHVLPASRGDGAEAARRAMDYITETYGVNYEVYEVLVLPGSPLVGVDLDEIESKNRIRVIAIDKGDGLRFGPSGVDRGLGIEPGSILGVLGSEQAVRAFTEKYNLKIKPELEIFAEALVPTKAGIAELVIPPGSKLIGKSARDTWMRKTYGLSLLAIHRGGNIITREGEGVRDTPLQSGDCLVCHTHWTDLARLESNRNFVIVTTEYPHEELRPQKVSYAVGFFLLALSLIIFTDTRLSICLMTGAIGMVLSGVMSMEEAYRAISWKTVFLLASLIPLGMAVESSGTAAWIAGQFLGLIGENPAIWLVQLAIAVLATFFTLVMSNVGATVLLVPLAVNIAIGVNADPAVFALTVALATSNSFLIPTHQVNALIMGPGNYRVFDYIKAGSIMTVLFLAVMLIVLNIVY